MKLNYSQKYIIASFGNIQLKYNVKLFNIKHYNIEKPSV